jgi:peptidoglycan biosynthesis protein MviN/MurJ (putative lipid II flippase)
MISAMKANYILLWGAILNLAVNYIGNFTLMRIYGVAGISFSTSFVYIASFLYLYFMFLLKYRRINEGR